jgi:hypothetical protein
MLSPVPKSPPSNTFFRPIRSLSRPQKIPLMHSMNAKEDVTMPVYIDICASLCPVIKDCTIKYAYGKIDMKAIGSHIRHKANIVSNCMSSNE